MAFTVCPTSHGMSTVITIASEANTSDAMTVRRYGRRKPSSRLKVVTTLDYTK